MNEYDIDRVARRLKGFHSRIQREDWIGQGINLNAVAPGKTETAINLALSLARDRGIKGARPSCPVICSA